MAAWAFDTPAPWTITVAAAPRPDACLRSFEAAVRGIFHANKGAARHPCAVFARVASRASAGHTPPAGSVDRAEALMDAIHDDLKRGPKYADRSVTSACGARTIALAGCLP